VAIPTYLKHKNKNRPEFHDIENRYKLEKLNTYHKLKIIMINGNSYQGDFTGFHQLDEITYKNYYKHYASVSSIFELPSINDTLIIFYHNKNYSIRGKFIGFDYYQILIKEIETHENKIVNMYEISEINFRDSKLGITEDIVQNLFRDELIKVPSYTGIGLNTGNKKILVPLHNIQILQKINKKYNLTQSTIIGLLGDLFVIFSAIIYIGFSTGGGLR
jgi:hypothetical protein